MGQIIQFLPGSRTIDSVILLHIGACRAKGAWCTDYGLMALWSYCIDEEGPETLEDPPGTVEDLKWAFN